MTIICREDWFNKYLKNRCSRKTIEINNNIYETKYIYKMKDGFELPVDIRRNFKEDFYIGGRNE